MCLRECGEQVLKDASDRSVSVRLRPQSWDDNLTIILQIKMQTKQSWRTSRSQKNPLWEISKKIVVTLPRLVKSVAMDRTCQMLLITIKVWQYLRVSTPICCMVYKKSNPAKEIRGLMTQLWSWLCELCIRVGDNNLYGDINYYCIIALLHKAHSPGRAVEIMTEVWISITYAESQPECMSIVAWVRNVMSVVC